MAEQWFTEVVRDQYNEHNDKCDIIARLNTEDLSPEHSAIFDQLNEEIKKRYYGSGIIIPENLEGKRVLDIGCGSGSLVFILSKLVGPTGYVAGMDVSDKLIETAKSQIEYHQRAWGYSKPNCEFSVGNAEKLDFEPETFDVVVSFCFSLKEKVHVGSRSNGVFCLCTDKRAAFESAYRVLKEGGQFYLSDVYGETELPAECRDDKFLWVCGAVGAMTWDKLAPVAREVGFTTPYLRQAAQAKICFKEYRALLETKRYLCAAWRLFKLPQGACREASRVTYRGNISEFPSCLKWDVDLTFQTGQAVDVDSELATILFSSYLSSNFDFEDTDTDPAIKRNQNPFAHMDKLIAEGKAPDFIFQATDETAPFLLDASA